MKKIFENTVRMMAVVSGLFACQSCNDSWDNHYQPQMSDTAAQTIWEQIEANPQLDNFAQVLKATRLYSSNKPTSITYAELLGGDQSFTVWAPIINDHIRDSLLALCQSAKGDSAVEKGFVKNHVARYIHTVAANTDKNVILYNRKVERLTYNAMGNNTIAVRNLTARNGVMHIIEGQLPYFNNLYELACSDPQYSLFGEFLQSYQRDSLDEIASVKGEIVDGQYTYVDSVMIEKNLLLSIIGRINAEDSTYKMLMPTNKAWQESYDMISSYYDYGTLANADSLQHYFTQFAIINDLVFSMNTQGNMEDSLLSVPYSRWNPKEHVFHFPYAEGGIFANTLAETECSNGYGYKIDEWPFKKTETFFKPIQVEAERESGIVDYTLCSYFVREALGDSVSKSRFLEVIPTTTAANPNITFEIPNTLSGTYDICVVCVPRTAYDENSTDFRPYMFRALLTYVSETGATRTYNANNKTFNNNPYCVDTVCVVENFKFPTCDYGQANPRVTLRLSSYITAANTTRFNRQMMIDCIYLIPREDQ